MSHEVTQNASGHSAHNTQNCCLNRDLCPRVKSRPTPYGPYPYVRALPASVQSACTLRPHRSRIRISCNLPLVRQCTAPLRHSDHASTACKVQQKQACNIAGQSYVLNWDSEMRNRSSAADMNVLSSRAASFQIVPQTHDDCTPCNNRLVPCISCTCVIIKVMSSSIPLHEAVRRTLKLDNTCTVCRNTTS
jgi:hypothetical protein